MSALEGNGNARMAAQYADRFDDGSPNAATLALVSGLLAIAEELERAGAGDSLVEAMERFRDAATADIAKLTNRVANLELAMRALAPTADLDDHRALARRYEELHNEQNEIRERLHALERRTS